MSDLRERGERLADACFTDDADFLLRGLDGFGLSLLGLLQNLIGVDRLQHAFRYFGEGLPIGGLHDFGFQFLVEPAFETDQAARQRFHGGDFGRAERGGIEELLETDGGLLLQRTGFGQHTLAHADGIHDQIAGLALNAGVDLFHFGFGDHADATSFHLFEEILGGDATHEKRRFRAA